MIKKRIIAEISISEPESSKIYTIDNNLINAEFEDLSCGNSSDLINFGIYANRGSLTFVDTENLYLELSQVTTTDVAKVQFKLVEGNITPRVLKTFAVQDFDVDKEANTVTLQLISNIIRWQDIKTHTIYMFSEEDTTIRELIDEINIFIPDEKNKLSIRNGFEDVFDKCHIVCPYLEPSTVWDLISKVCVFCGGRVYEDVYGNAYIDSMFYNKSFHSRDIMPNEILNISNIMPSYKNREKFNSAISVTCKNRQKKYDEIYGDVSFRIYDFTNNAGEEFTEYVATRDSLNPNITVRREDFPDAEIKFTTALTFVIRPTEKVYSHTRLKTVGNMFNYVTVGPNFQTTRERELSNLTPLVNFNRETNYCLIQNRLETQRRYDGNVTYVMDGVSYAYGNFFKDGEDVELRYEFQSDTETIKTFHVTTNELFQADNYYDQGIIRPHAGQYALNIHKRLSKDTLECECVYFDLPKDVDEDDFNFSCVSTVSPFVVENGNAVPFNKTSQNEYKIVGVKYRFSGFIRQTLYLQSYA